jgi:hypothetical protein
VQTRKEGKESFIKDLGIFEEVDEYVRGRLSEIFGARVFGFYFQ